MNKKILFLFFGCLLILAGCSSGTNTKEITVSAASSLKNALEEIESLYESEHENIDLTFNFGGSGTLVTQIQEGAPADIFFSASKDNFEVLENENKIIKSTNLLKNELVIVKNKNNELIDLEDINKIAIGTPEAVPAGTYAKQSLETKGLWGKVEDKLVMTKDVEEVLSYVQSNNVDIGIVYKTDAISIEEVEVIYNVDESLHDPIVYPIGLLNENQDVKDFYDYLQSDQAMQVFKEYGFMKNGS